MSKLNIILAFSAGAALGSFITWKAIKTKYEQITRDEIDAVKAMLINRYGDSTEDESESEDCQDEYEEKLVESEYTTRETIEEEGVIDEMPYVIAPDEFDDLENYDTNFLTLYADGVLTDDADEVIDDIEGTVGIENLDRIGEFEPDIIHVRNDRLRCDYEITLVEQFYEED